MAKQKKAPRTFLQYFLQEHWLGLGLIVIIALCGVSYFQLHDFCVSRTSANYFCAYAGLQPAHQTNPAPNSTPSNTITNYQQYLNWHNTASQNISVMVTPYIIKISLNESNINHLDTYSEVFNGDRPLLMMFLSSPYNTSTTGFTTFSLKVYYSNCTITNATILAPDGSSGVVNQSYAYSLLRINGYINSNGECSYGGN